MIFLSYHILRLEIIHPCPAALAVPRMKISIVNSKELTFLVKHFVGRYLGVINLNILVLLEGDAIQAFCQTKNTLFDILQLEIRFQIIVRDIVFLFLEFLAVITEVPGFDMSRIETVRLGVVLHFLHFLQSRRHVRIAQLVQQFIHILRRLCHAFVKGFDGIVLLTEQLGKRQTRIGDLDDQTRVVKLPAYALGGIRHI